MGLLKLSPYGLRFQSVSGVHTNPKRNRVDLKPPPRVVSEVYGFGQQIRRLRVDGRRNRTRPLRFRHEIGFVWTGPESLVCLRM